MYRGKVRLTGNTWIPWLLLGKSESTQARITLHQPVLLNELRSFADTNKFKKIVDATFGGGGYSEAFLSLSHLPKIHALDVDPNVSANAMILKKRYGKRFEFTETKFSLIDTIPELNLERPDLIVFDLGISIDQVHFFLLLCH
jgi:16S rRNA (cytosine1402-N4)-methyltransferase